MTENPYKSPDSDLDDNIPLKRSILWKVYFFFITLLSATGTVSYILADGSGIPEYIGFLSLVFATVGLYGYCFLKKIFNPKFWMIYLFAYISYGIIYVFITDVDIRMGMSDLEFYISWVIGLAMSFPVYYAIFSYGLSRNPIWRGA